MIVFYAIIIKILDHFRQKEMVIVLLAIHLNVVQTKHLLNVHFNVDLLTIPIGNTVNKNLF